VWRCAIVLFGLTLWQARGESQSIETAPPDSTGWTARFSRLPADDAARLRRKLIDELPKRVVAAARFALDEEAFETWKRRYAPAVRSLARGERLSADALYELWTEADRLEQLAIQRLSRAYRMQVYQTYREQRGEFDRRQRAWREIEAAWIAAGGWPEDQPQLVEWLKSAIWASRPGTLAALPPVPPFRLAPPTKSPAPQIAKTPKPKPAAPPKPSPRDIRGDGPSAPSSVATIPPRVSPPFIPREAPQADPRRSTAYSPSLSPPAAPSSNGRTPRRPASIPAPAAEPPNAGRPVAAVRLNIDEIAARVAGFNLALAALEQQLDQDGLVSHRRLAPLIDQLADLATRHGDIRPYYQYLSEGEARRLGELRSCVPAIRLSAAKVHATQRASHDAPPQQRDEIDRLSRRLAEIAANYHATESDPRPRAVTPGPRTH
jgi:hypothetical protein